MRLDLSLAVFAALLSFFSCGSSSESEGDQKDSVVVKEPLIEYGFNLDSFQVIRDTVQPEWTMSHMFSKYGVLQVNINLAASMASDSLIGLKYVKEGVPFLILAQIGDTSKKALYCVYPKNVVEFVVFDFRNDKVVVTKKEKETGTAEKILSGEIVKNSNLTFALDQQLKDINMTGEMAEFIAGVFAWTIDFFKLHPGDEFKVVYQEKSVEGTPYSVGDIKAAWFKHQGKEFFAFRYVLDSAAKQIGYFDTAGKEMKRPFLMAPVKYSRISSGFTMQRFHPVQKRWKAHLGTDYAAPHGTPIMATADGTVIAATYAGGNGNYVKIHHNETYETQYLHMSGFAPGIKKGVYVKQGDIIGYVGSTGLATGPHVCYRFWKNGVQIDHRAEKFPDSVPMVDSLLPNYLEYIKPIKAQLDSMPVTRYLMTGDEPVVEEMDE